MSASPATALLVLGMHRSGTSALTAVLNDLGASLGNELVAANDDNPGGYFENAGAVTAHEMLLAELDRGWEDLRELPEGWLQSAAGKRAQAGIAALLREEFAGVPLWALKDPRLCRLLPLWRPALAEAGIEAKALFVLRNPDEVAASLGKRDGIGAEIAHLLWLRHFLDAEVVPNEALYFAQVREDSTRQPPVMEAMKPIRPRPAKSMAKLSGSGTGASVTV